MFIQDMGTCYAHACVNAILLSPMRDMLANLGDRMATQHSLLMLERVKTFVDKCQQPKSELQTWLNYFKQRKRYLTDYDERHQPDPDYTSEQLDDFVQEMDEIKAFDDRFDDRMKSEFDKLTRGMIRFNFGDLFTLLLTTICRNMQAFDVTNDKGQRRGQERPARNRRVDHLYAIVCGKYHDRMVSTLFKRKDNGVVDIDGADAETEWLINYIFQFLGNTSITTFDRRRNMLIIDGEDVAVRFDMAPPVHDTELDCAAVSGAMVVPGHAVAFTQVHNRILVHDSNYRHPARLTQLASNMGLDLPDTDDARGDAAYMDKIWNRNNLLPFTLYFTQVTAAGGGTVPVGHRAAMYHRPAVTMPRASAIQAQSVRSLIPTSGNGTGYQNRRNPVDVSVAESIAADDADSGYNRYTDDDDSWNTNKSLLFLMMMLLYVASEEVDYVDGVDDGLVSSVTETEDDYRPEAIDDVNDNSTATSDGGTGMAIPVGGVVLAALTAIVACLPR